MKTDEAIKLIKMAKDEVEWSWIIQKNHETAFEKAIDALEKVEAVKVLLAAAGGQGFNLVRVEDDGTEHEVGKEELYEVIFHKMKEVIFDGEEK